MATGSKGKKSGSAGNTRNQKTNTNTKQPKKQENKLLDDVILLLVLAFSIYLYLCYFHVSSGSISNGISVGMFGIFGTISYLVPIALFLSVAFYISNRGKQVAWFKIGAILLLLLNLGCAISLPFLKEFPMNATAKEYFTGCVERHATHELSGGVIGCGFATFMKNTIGSVASWVLIVALVIISIVLITEKSFFKGVKHGSEKIYTSARDNANRRRERREVERLEAEYDREASLRRMDKRVSGVMLDTTLKNESGKQQDFREVMVDDYEEAEIRETLRKEHAINVTKPQEFVDDYIDELMPTKSAPKPKPVEPVEAVKPAVKPAADSVHIPIRTESGRTASSESAPAKPARKTEKTEALAISSSSSDSADGYVFPPISLLEKGKPTSGDSAQQLQETAQKLQDTLNTFGVRVSLTDISQGPTVTRYELEPEPGVKVSKIVGLADDIKLRMAATDIRIEAPIPGKAAVGIEIPNAKNATVMFRDLIETETFANAASKISFAVGKDLGGQVVVTDIGKMPHMLIAGATGSGKSVCINTLIMSILYKAKPDEVKLIMIDPKVVELSVYNGIPHLLVPVVTDPKKAAAALQWGVNEMTDRYNKFAELSVRDLKGYNKKVETLVDENSSDEDKEKYKKMPQIVIIVDELADLMMVAPGDVEDSICRLAQLARAAGIHLIIATQRPSVDVITGLIKANMPSRVAFSVSSGVDSRTILDMNGAEKLLGKGDMLFYPQGYPKPARIQGAFVSDSEVQEVVDFLKDHVKSEGYDSQIVEKMKTAEVSGSSLDSSSGSDRDELYIEAGRFIIENDKASIGNLQRKFKIGFNRAARIVDQLADDHVVGESEGTKPRQVLMSMEQFEQFVEESV